jgi:hypothetical protein
MSARSMCRLVALLLVAASSQAADVSYQHPSLTIVAKSEPLDTVLKSLGREMRIYITVPTGLNPLVNCDIQNQSIKQAFKTLLGDLSYSLEWEEGGERLVGVTILASGGESSVAAAPEPATASPAAIPPEPVVATVIESAAPAAPDGQGIPGADYDYTMAAHEARMAQEREAHEAEMAQRRQEEEVEREARMKDEIERHDAEVRAYVESQGIQLPP